MFVLDARVAWLQFFLVWKGGCAALHGQLSCFRPCSVCIMCVWKELGCHQYVSALRGYSVLKKYLRCVHAAVPQGFTDTDTISLGKPSDPPLKNSLTKVEEFFLLKPDYWGTKFWGRDHSYHNFVSKKVPSGIGVLLKSAEQRAIASDNILLSQLLTCNRGMSQHWLKHTHTTESIFSLVQSCDASAAVETSYDGGAGQTWSMCLSSDCGWSVRIRHQSGRGVAPSACAC